MIKAEDIQLVCYQWFKPDLCHSPACCMTIWWLLLLGGEGISIGQDLH
jgi:hypothetical protein